MKKLALVILLLNIVSNAQVKPIKVYSERNKENGDVTIYADNNSRMNYTVMINFTELQNAQRSYSSPYLRTVNPGKSTILTLKRSTTSKSSINYKYKYNYRKGCYNTKVDESVVYIIPTQKNKEVSIQYLNYIGSRFGKELPEGWEVYGFRINKGDTIFASRKGKVIEIQDNNSIESKHSVYDQNRNSIHVMHKDCSFGEYINIDKFYVREGDVVLPGQAIGTAKAKNTSDYSTLMFSVYYKDISVDLGGKMKSKNIYVPLKFDVNGRAEKLYEEKKYKSVHNFEIITQEMRKKEIKKYKKSLIK